MKMIDYGPVQESFVDPAKLASHYVEAMERARRGYAGDTHLGPEGRIYDLGVAEEVAAAEAPYRERALALQSAVDRDQAARARGERTLVFMGGIFDGLVAGPFLTDRQRSQHASQAAAYYRDGHLAAAEAWGNAEASLVQAS